MLGCSVSEVSREAKSLTTIDNEVREQQYADNGGYESDITVLVVGEDDGYPATGWFSTRTRIPSCYDGSGPRGRRHLNP